MKETWTYPPRLPRSLIEAVVRLSREDRQARADFKAFDKIMKRKGCAKPRVGDEMPS